MASTKACCLVLIYVFAAAPIVEAAKQATSSVTAVPSLVRFSGVVKDAVVPTNAVMSLTFGAYREAEGGSPLWLEIQNVTRDEEGRFTVLLGATTNEGLPAGLFDQPVWVGVQPNHPPAQEQPRVLLVSVPYAFKAADAETLGGRPASAYVLAGATTTIKPANGDIETRVAKIQGNDTPPIVANFTCTTGEFDGDCEFEKSVRVDGNLFFNYPLPKILFNLGGPTIGLPSANTLDFGTSGLTRMRIDQHGNVGVGMGVGQPTERLHVNGNLKFDATTQGILFGDGSQQKSANKHARVGFSINGSTSEFTTVTLAWPTAFANANYTVTCNVVDGGAGFIGLRLLRIEQISTSGIVAYVANDARHLRSGQLHCIAIAD